MKLHWIKKSQVKFFDSIEKLAFLHCTVLKTEKRQLESIYEGNPSCYIEIFLEHRSKRKLVKTRHKKIFNFSINLYKSILRKHKILANIFDLMII